ncbi:MAG: DUF1489 domain-containing protein [Pseudomonadota bacterium]
MALHIQKLCVGAETIEDLRAWIDQRAHLARRTGRPVEQMHVTRTMPKRADEIVGVGSLYWVIKGVMQCRQRIVELRPVEGHDGITRCGIVLDQTLVATQPRMRRPFQGWRYLSAEDAPVDLGDGESAANAKMPAEMRRELAALGLL